MLIVAAALVAAVGVLHSVLGERFVLPQLLRLDDLPPLRGSTAFTAGVLRLAWHTMSVLALGLASLLVLIAFEAGDAAILLAFAVTFFACAVLPLVFTRGRHPVWAVFLAAGLLCLLPVLFAG